MNERGHFFSEGNYDILGPPLTDGSDAITWMSTQPWANGKVGTIGCSSTAEWQLGVAAQGNPAFAAMIPQGFGAGVGRVGPYYEQGNWYRGGAVQMLFIAWLYGEQNQVRPMFPPNTSQQDLIRASREFDLAQQLPPVDWSRALQHLPEMDIIKAVDGPPGIFADRVEVATGGAMIKRIPNARSDILVYTSDPLKERIEVSGPIEPSLYVSSDAKDTDITVKVIDEYPDGTAYNLDETIQRLRYRDGYEKPEVWTEPGKVYKVTLQPMTTSNYFPAGHRIRIEVSSSNFPRFDRNLNTGGKNYDETKGVVAHNQVHHSAQYPSQITLTIVKN